MFFPRRFIGRTRGVRLPRREVLLATRDKRVSSRRDSRTRLRRLSRSRGRLRTLVESQSPDTRSFIAILIRRGVNAPLMRAIGALHFEIARRFLMRIVARIRALVEFRKRASRIEMRDL